MLIYLCFKGILESVVFLLLWKESTIFTVAVFKHGSSNTLNFLFALGDTLRHWFQLLALVLGPENNVAFARRV